MQWDNSILLYDFNWNVKKKPKTFGACIILYLRSSIQFIWHLLKKIIKKKNKIENVNIHCVNTFLIKNHGKCVEQKKKNSCWNMLVEQCFQEPRTNAFTLFLWKGEGFNLPSSSSSVKPSVVEINNMKQTLLDGLGEDSTLWQSNS